MPPADSLCVLLSARGGGTGFGLLFLPCTDADFLSLACRGGSGNTGSLFVATGVGRDVFVAPLTGISGAVFLAPLCGVDGAVFAASLVTGLDGTVFETLLVNGTTGLVSVTPLVGNVRLPALTAGYGGHCSGGNRVLTSQYSSPSLSLRTGTTGGVAWR